MNSIHKQQGLSLIELMISVTLSLVLMAAATQYILSIRQTYELNEDISRIQENGRVAMDILVKDAQMAGYRLPTNGNGEIPDFFQRECTKTSGVQVPNYEPCLYDDGDGDADANTRNFFTSDVLAIKKDPPPDDGTEEDCQGNAIGAFDVITNVYFVADLDSPADGINSLYCRTYNLASETWATDAPQPLVDGIDNIQLLYGIASNDDTPDSVTRYVSGEILSDAVGDDDDWLNIRSVRISLLVSNGLAEGSAESKARNYRMLDSDLIAYTDRQPRRIYTTTVQFNNRSDEE